MTTSELQSLADLLGDRALCFLLAVTAEQLQSRLGQSPILFSEERENALAELAAFNEQARGNAPEEMFVPQQWTTILAEVDPATGLSRGNLVRSIVGGDIADAPAALVGIEKALAQLTIDSYSAFLVKEPDGPFGHFGLPVLLHRNPRAKEFQDHVMADPVLSKLFPDTASDATGPSGYTMRNTGQGGSLQLVLFAETLLASGLRLARASSAEPSVGEIIAAVLTGVEALRLGIKDESATIPVRIGLAGVLLPEGMESLDLGWATLRRDDARNAQFTRATTLTGELTTTTQSGETLAISYAGDVVLEFDAPYALALGQTDPASPWPVNLEDSFRNQEEFVENVRLGLLLAIPDRHPTLVSTWRVALDPLAHGASTGWRDSTRSSLNPMQLTEDEAHAWATWATRIHTQRTPSIAVAIRRMLAAVADRHSTDDKLVDAVIVWENLFGARSETVLRVTSSLAWLLGSSPEDRREKQKYYKKIYGVRSDVVHGAATVKLHQIDQFSHEAVEIAIAALQAVFTTHADLLKVPSSEERSIRILHDGDVTS